MKELQTQAYKYGRKARTNGIKAVAVLDPDVMKLIRRNDQHTPMILRAWFRGWQAAGAA